MEGHLVIGEGLEVTGTTCMRYLHLIVFIVILGSFGAFVLKMGRRVV